MNEPEIQFPVIAITGNRDYADRAALLKGLDGLRADKYLLGGARGVDTDALQYLARTQPFSQRVVVVPNTLADQPAATIPITSRNASQIIELRNVGSDRYMIRNRYLVDNSDYLKAFTDLRGSGGTYNTIEYAKSTGRNYSLTVLLEQDLNKYLELSDGAFRLFMDQARANGVPLSAVKGIITSYFYAKRGYIPDDVVALLQRW